MPQKDPFLYLSGMNSTVLNLIIEYIYRGETTIEPDSVDAFLDIAFKLKIGGLCQTDWDKENEQVILKMLSEGNHSNEVIEQAAKDEFEPENNSSVSGSGQNMSTKENQEVEAFEKEVIKGEKDPKNHFRRINRQRQYSEEIESLISKIHGVYNCKQCGKTTRDRTNLKEHIEGMEFICDNCGKIVTTTGSLRKHKRMCYIKRFN